MFTKSWAESKNDIAFYLNHNDEQAPGKVVDVFEDNKEAFTKAWLGTHTLGNDVLTMMDEGVIKKASFGYITTKSNFTTVKGQKVRELKEVAHIETSVLTKIPANMKAGVRSVTKSADLDFKMLSSNEQRILKAIAATDQTSLEQLINLSATLDQSSDLYTWITYNISRRSDLMGELRGQIKYNSGEIKALESHVKVLEKFTRDTKASDDCIKSILIEIENAKQILSDNTALTHDEPGASGWSNWFSGHNQLIKLN